jgi:hypothetical protein
VDSVTRATLQNLCWASALGVAVGLSPFSSPALMPSIAAGLATGGALFWYLERLRRQKSAREPREEVEGGASASHLPPSVVASLALLGVAFAPTLAWLYAKSTASIWTNGHGLFTPLIMGYLAYSTLRRDDGAGEAASRWGFVFVSVGLGLLIADLVRSLRDRRDGTLKGSSGAGASPDRLHQGLVIGIAVAAIFLVQFGRPLWLILTYDVIGSLVMPPLAFFLLRLNSSRGPQGRALGNGVAVRWILLASVALFLFLGLRKIVDVLA